MLLYPNNKNLQRFPSLQLVLKWVKGSEISWNAVKKPAAVQIISAFHYRCLFDGHAVNCVSQISIAHFWSRPIRSPIWGVCFSGRSGTLETRLDVKSKLFRDFGEQLRDRRAVKKCPFGTLGCFIRPSNRHCCLIGSWPTSLFSSAIRVPSNSHEVKHCDLVNSATASKHFLFFCLDLSFFPDSRPDSHLGWTMTPLGLNGAGLPDLGANNSEF